MIFVTVGGQLPFDRMIRIVDRWAHATHRDDVFCQILDGAYEPAHAQWTRTLEPAEFQERLRAADLVVAHAGMGTIITTLEYGRPVLVLPRQAALQEQRNDHQLATAQRFRESGQIHVAMDDDELLEKLNAIDALTAAPTIGATASRGLLDAVAKFVHEN